MARFLIYSDTYEQSHWLWLGRVAVGTNQQDVERRMIGMQDGVRTISLSPVYQFESVAVSFYAFVGRVTRSAPKLRQFELFYSWSHLAKIFRKPLHLPI